MSKVTFLIMFITTMVFSASAQRLNIVPPVATHNYPNGWHKFIDQGVIFDVEIIDNTFKQGNVTWLDESQYSGTLIGYTITGKGTYTWSDKKRYEGSFKDNEIHGWGVMYYKDGTKYTGKWKNSKKQGKGKIYDKNGSLVHEGIWNNDVFVEKKKK